MSSLIKIKSRVWFAAALCFVVVIFQSCSSVEPDRVKQEEGYLYGYGKGGSPQEAENMAKQDLIKNALELSLDRKTGESHHIYVSAEVARGIPLETKKVAELKESGTISITVRASEKDWFLYEEQRDASMRKNFLPAISRATDERPFSERVIDAKKTLLLLESAGIDGSLTVSKENSQLVSNALMESLLTESQSFTISLNPCKGIISTDMSITVTISDISGAPVAGVPLIASWMCDDSIIESESPLIKTNEQGQAGIRVPQITEHNDSVSLVISSDFAVDVSDTTKQTHARLQKINEHITAHAIYVLGESLAKSFGPFIPVESGEFTMGAVSGDKRASKREGPKASTTNSYNISAYPVTNAQYRLFLDATGYEKKPDFMDNPDYTLSEQPVVGINQADVTAFLDWLSSVMGKTMRLPTEAEWEKAAKAGRNVTFPWGNESNTEGNYANYRGNGKFKRPSPVSAFPNGANPWGIYDMAGNVWEMVYSTAEGPLIAKGGSWMEGANDVRISNKRDIDPAMTYADVGFRIVMEDK